MAVPKYLCRKNDDWEHVSPDWFYLDYFEWRNLLKNFIPDWDVLIMAVTSNQ